MTSEEMELIVEQFLHTLDKFGLTSSDYRHPLYLETEALMSYWLRNGIEVHG